MGLSKNALTSAALFQKTKKMTVSRLNISGDSTGKMGIHFHGQNGFTVIIPVIMPFGYHYLASVSEENVQIWQ